MFFLLGYKTQELNLLHLHGSKLRYSKELRVFNTNSML